MEMRAVFSNKKLNVLGIAILLAVIALFAWTLHASAASSSFEYSGTNINGKSNGEFHYLDPGTAYLTVTDRSGAAASVKLYRQVTWGFDPSYGSVGAATIKTYTFPSAVDTSSGSYYLVVSASSYTYGYGFLHN